MLRISRQTGLNPASVIEAAARFFGQDGQGLQEKERSPCCILFEGAGGYIFVSVVDDTKLRKVDVETREFEYQAKEFLTSLR